jgi:hypothetical protein
MSIRVGVEMGVPGVIKGPSDELALAATAIDRHPKRVCAAAPCRVHARACWGLDGWMSGRGARRRDALRAERSIVEWLRRWRMDAICLLSKRLCGRPLREWLLLKIDQGFFPKGFLDDVTMTDSEVCCSIAFHSPTREGIPLWFP